MLSTFGTNEPEISGWISWNILLVLRDIFKNGLFLFLFLSFQTNIAIFTTNIGEKLSIQYMVLEFEPTTINTCLLP